jgi:hypothetical protein
MSAQPQTLQSTLIPFPSQSTDAQLEARLSRYQELKAMASEFEALKKELKPLFEGTERIQVGRFVVTGKTVSRKECLQPACTYWDMRIAAI